MPETRTAVHIDSVYLDHAVPPDHPERPDRIRALLKSEALFDPDGVVRMSAGRKATREELLLVHTPAHIDRIAATAGKPHGLLESDTTTSERSYETALLAAGGVLDVVDAVMRGDVGRGLALVRPPGHHAENERAMGFCLFNNVAVAARYLIEKHGLERVLVVDWDVHHGNGTQQIFYDDERVLFASLPQFPLYPGTGAADETGAGDGRGYTVNVPIPPGGGDEEYLAALREVVAPIADQFEPQFVLISAGFDAHRDDPLAALLVTESGYAAMAALLLDVAARHADGRAVGVLEGGYNLGALARSVEAVVRVMCDYGSDAGGGGVGRVGSVDEVDEVGGFDRDGRAGHGASLDVVSPVREIQSKFWNV
jgi:acetoin utilization deacetylase AcuC-like enzyme